MSVIVNDDGFREAKPIEYDGMLEIWLEPDADIKNVDFSWAGLVSVHFPKFSDGRGFGIAKVLRARGYTGTLRASGYVIADQYAMARRVGFDEVEISDELATRQDFEQWQARADWKAFDYQARLGQTVGGNIRE